MCYCEKFLSFHRDEGRRGNSGISAFGIIALYQNEGVVGDHLGALTIKLLKEFENGFHCSDIVQHFDVIGMTFLSLFFFLFI